MITNYNEQFVYGVQTCESHRETEENCEKSPHLLEREILNEISQQELYTKNLMNQIDSLEHDIISSPVDFKYKELYPQEKENKGLFLEELKKNKQNGENINISNEDYRYSKMSETQAENLYQERMAQLLNKYNNSNPVHKKSMKSKKTPSKYLEPTKTISPKPQIKSTKENSSSFIRKDKNQQNSLYLKKKQPLSKNSKKTSSNSSFSKNHELYNKGIEHINFRQQLILKNEENKLSKQIEQCTFTPILNKKPRYLKSYESIIEKTKKSQQKKDQKSNDSQDRRLESELRECTFTPFISKYRQETSKSRSSSLSKSIIKGRPSTVINSFQKTRSASSLFKKQGVRAGSISSVKQADFSMSSSRNSFKNDEKKRFRKVNEEFLKNKGKNQVFNTDFQKKKKKTDIKLKSPVIGAVKKKIVPEEFSKEINETLDIFNQIRSQIKGKNTSKSSKRPIEANFKPNFKRNNSNIIKKNESTRKTSKHVEKKLNSIGKIDYDSRKTKEKFGGTVRNEKKEEKFSKKIIDLYKEDIKYGKNEVKINNTSKVMRGARKEGLKGKYEGLLKQAENITQHLNNVLFAK